MSPSGHIVDTNVVLTVPSAGNERYGVQRKADLGLGSWTSIASNIVATGGVLRNIDVGAEQPCPAILPAGRTFLNHRRGRVRQQVAASF